MATAGLHAVPAELLCLELCCCTSFCKNPGREASQTAVLTARLTPFALV